MGSTAPQTTKKMSHQQRILEVDTALITPRTVIRRFRENDGSAFLPLFQDNQGALLDLVPPLFATLPNADTIEHFVRLQLALWLHQEAFCFGIWSRESALPIGYVRLNILDWSVPKAELAFFIDREHQQKGIMTEVLEYLRVFAFDQLQVEKIVLRLASDNYPGQRLARKCGFLREGDLRAEHRKASGELVDLMVYGALRTRSNP